MNKNDFLFVMGKEDADKISDACKKANDNMVVSVKTYQLFGIPEFSIRILPQGEFAKQKELNFDVFKDITDYESW